MFGLSPLGVEALGGGGQPPTSGLQTVETDFAQTFAILAAPAQPVTVTTDFAQTFAILAAQAVTVSTNFPQSFAVLAAAGSGKLPLVSFSRIVIHEGSGPRLEFGAMTAKPAYKQGDKWYCDRDPDEKTRYAQDITDELQDRKTTALPSGIELVLLGVASLEDPVLEQAMIGGELRTFVIAFLGSASGQPPATSSWTARVSCANGERFDATIYFNRKDT